MPLTLTMAEPRLGIPNDQSSFTLRDTPFYPPAYFFRFAGTIAPALPKEVITTRQEHSRNPGVCQEWNEKMRASGESLTV